MQPEALWWLESIVSELPGLLLQDSRGMDSLSTALHIIQHEGASSFSYMKCRQSWSCEHQENNHKRTLLLESYDAVENCTGYQFIEMFKNRALILLYLARHVHTLTARLVFEFIWFKFVIEGSNYTWPHNDNGTFEALIRPSSNIIADKTTTFMAAVQKSSLSSRLTACNVFSFGIHT
jgi:hypothetical protein